MQASVTFPTNAMAAWYISAGNSTRKKLPGGMTSTPVSPADSLFDPHPPKSKRFHRPEANEFLFQLQLYLKLPQNLGPGELNQTQDIGGPGTP